jgi:hypothetical protein
LYLERWQFEHLQPFFLRIEEIEIEREHVSIGDDFVF